MSIVVTLLAVLLLALCLLMLLVILMQRPKQEGLGAAFGGGMMDGVLGSGTTSFLQKGTVYMSVGYFLITVTMAVIQARTSDARSLSGRNLEAKAAAAAAAGVPDDQPEAETPGQPTGTVPVPEPAPAPVPDGEPQRPADTEGAPPQGGEPGDFQSKDAPNDQPAGVGDAPTDGGTEVPGDPPPGTGEAEPAPGDE